MSFRDSANARERIVGREETTLHPANQELCGFLSVQNKAKNELEIVRVELRNDLLCVQREEMVDSSVFQFSPNRPLSPSEVSINRSTARGEMVSSGDTPPAAEVPVRHVILKREGVGGLGLSIKGGAEHNLPLLVSKIFTGQAAHRTGNLFEGDMLIEVDGVNVENACHAEVVQLLRQAGQEVSLVVKKYQPLLHGSSGSSELRSAPSRHGGRVPSLPSVTEHGLSSGPVSSPSAGRWVDDQHVPLTKAFLSQRMPGTDKLRPCAFQVSSANDQNSIVLYCNKGSDELARWCAVIRERIADLNKQAAVAMSASLPPADKISMMGWVSVRQSSTGQWQNYTRHFMVLRKNYLEIYPGPPEEDSRAVYSYPLLSFLCTAVKDECLRDEWPYCLSLSSASGHEQYVAIESYSDLQSWLKTIRENALDLASTVKRKAFAGHYRRNNVIFTVDIDLGFSLVDTFDKSLLWKHGFSKLARSSDDGQRTIKFAFRTQTGNRSAVEYEVEFPDCEIVLNTIHTFMLARLNLLDPNTLINTTL